jgi:hypothetical protein
MITLRPRVVTRWLLATVAMAFALHLVALWLAIYGMDRFGRSFDGYTIFDLDGELSVSTWIQQMLLAVCAVAAAAIGRLDGGSARRYWYGLAVIFVALSVDEGAALHERLIDPLRSGFDITGGIFWFAWLIPALLALGVFAAVYVRFWWRLDEEPRRWMALGGAIFVLGAVGLEMIGGAQSEGRIADYTYVVIIGIEESLEMIGATLFLRSLLIVLSPLLESRPSLLEIGDR